MSARLRAFLAAARDDEPGLRSAHPLQRPNWFMPGLSAQPFPASDPFPWVSMLERATNDITQELRALERSNTMARHPEGDALVGQGEWQLLQLYRNGRRFEDHCARCPVTTHLLESIPGALEAGSAYFSRLEPQTHVEPHCGPTNVRIRCHLPLHVPRGATLRVAGESRAWRRGRALLFDDSFEHEAINPSRSPRVVLLFDVWHPELTRQEIRGLARWLARPAEGPWRPVGALRAFSR